jgi:hypothetical protein
MIGKRSAQRGLFEADHLYLDYVGRDTFYGFLAAQRGKLFEDEEFAQLYCPDNGRRSVPPSLLATALLLQTHDRVSDVLHDKMRAIFQGGLDFARRTGYLKKRRIKVALDTSNILGKGAVKDTYNLLGDGIVKLVRALAAGAEEKPQAWARERGLSRYFGSSLKGEARLDWDDESARRRRQSCWPNSCCRISRDDRMGSS